MKEIRRSVLITSLFAIVFGALQITTPAAAASAPTAPHLDNIGWDPRGGLVAMGFTDMSTNERGFRVQRRVPGTSWQSVRDIPNTGAGQPGSTGSTYTARFESQPLPLEQCYRIQAWNDDGSSYSRDHCTGPGIPDQLTLISKTATSVTLSWRDRALNERYSDLYAGYASDHELSLGVVAHWRLLPDRHAISTVTVRNLRPNIVYEFSVKAFNNVGSAESNPRLTARTPAA